MPSKRTSRASSAASTASRQERPPNRYPLSHEQSTTTLGDEWIAKVTAISTLEASRGQPYQPPTEALDRSARKPAKPLPALPKQSSSGQPGPSRTPSTSISNNPPSRFNSRPSTRPASPARQPLHQRSQQPPSSSPQHQNHQPQRQPPQGQHQQPSHPPPVTEDSLRLTFDPDAHAFSQSLDKWTAMMHRAVVADFLSVKSDMLARQTSEMAEARRLTEEEIRGLKEKVDAREAEAKREKATRVKMEALMERCLKFLEEKRRRSSLGLVFARWRLRQMAVHLSRAASRTARTHASRTLLRKTLHCWKEVAGTNWRRTIEGRIKAEAEKAMEQLAAEYDGRIVKLEAKLKDVHEKLHVSEEARGLQEEDMKKAFMRGVCALNMEAMSMFRPPMAEEFAPPPAPIPREFQSEEHRQQRELQERQNQREQQQFPSRPHSRNNNNTAYAGMVGSNPALYAHHARTPSSNTAATLDHHRGYVAQQLGLPRATKESVPNMQTLLPRDGKTGSQPGKNPGTSGAGRTLVTRHATTRETTREVSNGVHAVRAGTVIAHQHAR
ncbi:Centrosomal protein poc5 [Thoreauomyces humboldtii]|nr:Centrosomal protein poc5 [Thoreauomyces humboldtii]